MNWIRSWFYYIDPRTCIKYLEEDLNITLYLSFKLDPICPLLYLLLYLNLNH